MSGSVRIKICGVTTPACAEAAVEAGANLIGLNFVPGSPRFLDIHKGEEISRVLEGTGVERVALFRNASWDEIDRVLRVVDVERVQFHGEETEQEVELVDFPVIKALRGADLETAEEFPGAILLLDHPSEGGGRGKAWDWSEASELIARGMDVILAGGLTAENVSVAIEAQGDLLPWGVDVATGVEGDDYLKDPAKLKAFVAAVRAAEGDPKIDHVTQESIG